MQASNPQHQKQVWTNVGENLWRLEASGVYYAMLKRGRKQFRRSLKTSDRTLAKRRLHELQKDVARLSTSESSSISFSALAERWLSSARHTVKESTVLRRQTCLKAISPFFRGVTVRNITARHCQAWITKRGNKIAPQTFAHELDTMRAVLNFGVSLGLILTNPAQDIKRKRILPAQIEVPSREQFQLLIAKIRESDGRPSSQAVAKNGADLVELLAYSGMRIDEARNLKWEDVSFERNCITVTGGKRRTKNYEARVVPMNDALGDLLSHLHSETNPERTDFVVKIQSAKKSLQTACRKLGFSNFTHHDFRHFFATTCIETGVDVPTVSRWLGHKDGGALAMKVYGHLRQDHSFAQMKRVKFSLGQAENVVNLNYTAAG